jgi:hypothetical protein
VLRGTASDKSCGGRAAKVRHVSVSIAKQVGKRCRYLRSDGRFTRQATSCTRSRFIAARGASRWSFTSKRPLPAGHYRIWVRAQDRARNVELKKASRNGRRVTLRHG